MRLKQMLTRRWLASWLYALAALLLMPGVSAQPLLAEQPRLQTLLREEMRALQTGISKIANALPQGDWKTVANTAMTIHDSFIFQQKLTAQDREHLHHLLPPEFVSLDQQFHQRAARLQAAATAEDADLSLYHFSRLIESCIHCHQRFATQRFPALQAHSPQTPHH